MSDSSTLPLFAHASRCCPVEALIPDISCCSASHYVIPSAHSTRLITLHWFHHHLLKAYFTCTAQRKLCKRHLCMYSTCKALLEFKSVSSFNAIPCLFRNSATRGASTAPLIADSDRRIEMILQRKWTNISLSLHYIQAEIA